MAAFQFTGQIISITPEIDKNGFKSRFLRVKEPNMTNDKYSNKYEIQVSTDKYPIIDKFKAGATVTVHANVVGNEYTSKANGQLAYATNLKLWKMELAGAETQEYSSAVHQRAENAGFQGSDPSDANDIPF